MTSAEPVPSKTWPRYRALSPPTVWDHSSTGSNRLDPNDPWTGPNAARSLVPRPRRCRAKSLRECSPALLGHADERGGPGGEGDAEGDLGGPFELIEFDDGAHLEGGYAVHAEREHERPVRRVVAERELADDVAPDADRDHQREPERGCGPGERDQSLYEGCETVDAR